MNKLLIILVLFNFVRSYLVSTKKVSLKMASKEWQLSSSSTGELNDLKLSLLALSSKTARGEIMNENQLDQATEIIAQLEVLNPAFDKPNEVSLLGKWELIFTDGQLFENSPFFMQVRQLLGDDSAKAKRTFQMHRRATSTGQIGRVLQIISAEELISEVDLKVGLLPGIPYAIEGTVVSKASYEKRDAFTLDLQLKETYVTGSNVPILKNLISDRALPTGPLLQRVKKDSKSTLTTYYLDEDMRITRNKDDNFFVYVRAK